jgi:hypothetical protein
MSIEEKKALIAQWMGVSVVPNYNECWNSLMEVVNRLKLASTYYPVSFTANQLNFDIEIVFENCFDYVKLINGMS